MLVQVPLNPQEPPRIAESLGRVLANLMFVYQECCTVFKPPEGCDPVIIEHPLPLNHLFSNHIHLPFFVLMMRKIDSIIPKDHNTPRGKREEQHNILLGTTEHGKIFAKKGQPIFAFKVIPTNL